MNLYNQANGAERQRITKKVKEWFTETAHADGWDQVGFLPEVESEHGAGCILYKSFGSSRGDNIVKKLSSD
ncbi:hypothetical protein [Dyella sp.]|uniref:hypothetical protein n=1 Tax=Dyella sp. TaxID=1869338 RepID=UPI002ED19C77